MAHPLLYSNTADRLLSALCDTLLHSLWQGIILAVVAGLIVICTRKASSALRYKLLVSSLLLFAIGVGATFAWQYESSAVSAVPIQPMPHVNGYAAHAYPQPVEVFVSGRQVAAPGFATQFKDYLADHHNTIVFIWFLIVCARSLQLAFGLYGTYRLRRVRVFAADGQWAARLQQLADRLHIKQAVRLLESGLAKVPMVIGHLKPVVLVPIGLLTALSADEVEAILIHELAHIKRRDYLVNMLQSLLEIVLFFNPAVLWVSKLIRTERENCCDDLALAQNNNKLSYIRALVSCEEYQASVPVYAMGFPGGKNTLLNRVKRMATNRNYSLNLVEKTVLAICLVVLGLGISAFTAREDIKKAVKTIVAAIHHQDKGKERVKADTTKKKQTDVNALLGKIEQLRGDTFKTTGNAQLDALVHNIDSLKGAGSLGSLKGNFALSGKPDTGRYSKILEDLLAKKDQPDSNLLKSLLADKSWQNNKMLAVLMAKSDSTSKVFTAVANDLYRDHFLSNTSHLNITLNEKELTVNGVRLPQDVHDRYYSKYGDKFDDSKYNGNYTDGKTGSGRTYTNYTPVPVGDAGKPTQGNVNLQGEDEKTRNIINDMLKDGIINTTDDLSFKIGTTEFVVNYKKQPEAVYQKYKAKYVPAHKKGDWIWFYKFDTQKWDQMTGRKSGGDFDGTATGVFQGKEDANSGYNRKGYNGTSGAYSASANYYNRWDARSDSLRDARNKAQAEIDKKLVADLLQDGLITDPKNVTFDLSDKRLKINGKKQSDELYKKYKDKYHPDSTGSNWNWTYSHHE